MIVEEYPARPIAERVRAGRRAREGLHVDVPFAESPNARHQVSNDVGGVFDQRAPRILLALAYGGHAAFRRGGEGGDGDDALALIVRGELQVVIARVDAAVVVEQDDAAQCLVSGHAVGARAGIVDFRKRVDAAPRAGRGGEVSVDDGKALVFKFGRGVYRGAPHLKGVREPILRQIRHLASLAFNQDPVDALDDAANGEARERENVGDGSA